VFDEACLTLEEQQYKNCNPDSNTSPVWSYLLFLATVTTGCFRRAAGSMQEYLTWPVCGCSYLCKCLF